MHWKDMWSIIIYLNQVTFVWIWLLVTNQHDSIFKLSYYICHPVKNASTGNEMIARWSGRTIFQSSSYDPLQTDNSCLQSLMQVNNTDA